MKSILQRARSRLDELPVADAAVPSGPEARALLGAYIAAFEKADPAALERLLREDATLELPPSATWYAGGDAIRVAMSALSSPGEWRMLPTSANGQPAAAVYRRDASGGYEAYGIVLLTTTLTQIVRITGFADPGLLAAFGFPSVLS